MRCGVITSRPRPDAAYDGQGTEVAFQPMGDVTRELSAFARAAGLQALA